ncbi:hypothetical protein OH77DRAFT_255932 [Trametes cingulata]|nr:hypothetical protein OH77DRAFT_255932 [Trametes cingulata]
MDAFDNVPLIPGSRRPILIPAHPDTSSSSSHTPTPQSAESFNSLSSVSRHRRKPAKVYKSPSADEPAQWEARTVTRKRATPPYEKPSARQSSSEASRSSPPISVPARRAAAQRKVPLLPLYHPLGPLAQSLPELDPGQFGLPSSLNIEDPDEQRDSEADRRSASRAQRPGQKVRERDTGDNDTQSNGTPNGTGKPGQEAPARNASPRKRRGGGAKRKRKDAEDGDTAFPAPPAKRTRNPRGAANNNAPAAPSPLISEAVAASDLVEDATEANADGDEEAQEEAAPAPKRSARTRKPRTRPAKRRDSSGSASTTTSVSVSIAATTKPAAEVKPEAAPAVEPEPQVEAARAAEPEKEVPLQAQDATEDEKRGAEEVTETPAAQRESQPAEPPANVPPTSIPPPPERVEPPPKASDPPPPPAPVRPPSPPPVPSSQKEEREEGELSDE